MKSRVSLLIPFDLGLELDFVGQDAKEVVKEVSSQPPPVFAFKDQVLKDVQLTAQVYKFGVGLINLSFPLESPLEFLAALSCQAETMRAGDTDIRGWAKTLVDGLIARAREFASYEYERRLDEFDVFPIFVFEKGEVQDAQEFIQTHQKALYGIVAGEPNYDALSDFVLDQEKLINFGYYENELILIKRFGAVVSSAESRTILDLIRLAYALYWSLRAYNSFLDLEIDQAQALLARLPPYYKVWAMPRRYQKFSREAIDFVKDKLAIVDSMYNVSVNIPRVDSDWHLRTVYKNIQREFDIEDVSKAVEVKLERIEESYNSARDLLSTNFFIAVEIVLILSLFWMVLDTCLLFIIAHK